MYETALAAGIRHDIQLRGSGGGGDSPRQPIESPDSLRSIAYARIQDLISEGEIFGFADQEHPLTCMYLNETPVANADGTLNFKNVQVDSRVGTQTQDYMKGFDGVRNETGVGVELRADTPWTRTFTNLNLSAVNVRISTPLFQKTDTSTGDIGGASVYYAIQLSIDGGPFNTIMTGGFVGKTTTKYERGHRIDLPSATTSWTIRLQRLTPDSTSGALIDNIFVEAFTEIIDVKLRMPMSAYVGTIVDAEQFQSIPQRAFHMKGRIIRVPSNYDPDTRTYTGVWDGTFQSRYSNNPAWVFYDMALNERYGLGHLVPQQFVDKWALYRIAQYCDELVSDGRGGTEPRFTCNVYLQEQNDALQVMQDLATVFRGIMYAAGGSIVPVADMPEDAVYTYTNANVDDGSFDYSGSAKKVRFTVALVSWNDMTDFCRPKVEYVPDEAGIARYGVQETQVIAVGCTSQSQAQRLGRYLLATNRLETDSVAFGVGLDGLRCAPGKIINIADRLRAKKRIGGRIVSATSNTVTLDSLPEISIGDTLIITNPDGEAVSKTIFFIDGPVITIEDTFDAIPLAQSVWAVSTLSTPIVKYRVLGVMEKDTGLGYTVHAIKHVSGKFAFVDNGTMLDEAPVPQVPSSVVPSPMNLEVVTRNVVEQNIVTKVATLSWDAVAVASNYNVQWRSNQGGWIDAGNNASTTREIYGIPSGPFEIQVVAIDSLGRRSLPTYGGPYDVITPDQPPGVVTDVQNDLTQEILDRFNADAAVAAAAAADATAKADAALAAAQAYADVIGAQLNDIIEADAWNAATAYVVGDIVQYAGKLYRAETANTNQQPDTNPDDWLVLGNYTSLGEAVAASIQTGIQNASDIEAVSTSLSAVVARMPAGVGALATQASVADEATARATADTALGNRITVVEARMPSGSGELATASALTSLDARVTTAEGQIATQSSAITAVQTSLGDTRRHAAMLYAPGFEDATKWTLGAAGTIVNNAANARNGGRYLSVGAGAPSAVAATSSDRFAVTPGGKLRVGFYARQGASAPNGYVRVSMRFYDAADTQITFIASTASTLATAGNLTTYSKVDGTIDVPANAVWAAYVIQQNNTVGEWRVDDAYCEPFTENDVANASAIALLDTRLTSAEGTITSQGTAITTVQARLPAGSGVLATAAAVTALDTRVTAAEGNITALSTAVTDVRATLGGGGNLARNTAFEVDLSGWSRDVGSIGASLAMDRSTGFAVGSGDITTRYIPNLTNALQLRVPSVAVASGQFGQAYSDPVAVQTGRYYIASCYVNNFRCQAVLMIAWYNAAGAYISENQAVQNPTSLANPTMAQMARISVKAAPPAGGASARVILRMWGTGASDPYIWFVRPMLEEVPADKTLPSEWREGGSGIDTKYAAVTQSLQTQVTTAQSGVTTLFARYTLVLDVNGYISGLRSENTGSTSTFDVLSDNFRILKPGGGARFEFSSGNGRVYDSGNVLRVRWGVWS